MQSVFGRVADADAFVFITPEYNHSLPGVDQGIHRSARRAMVRQGDRIRLIRRNRGGLRSVEALRLVFASLNAATVRNTVSFANAWDQFAGGTPSDPNEVPTQPIHLSNSSSGGGMR